LTAHLHKKGRMSDEGDTELSVADQAGLVGAAGAGSDRRVANQSPELLCPLAQGRIPKSRFNHEAKLNRGSSP
jgi:hypothetical protein